ncbi:MAG: hypothetical protein BJ554DRAFT_2463, partial [Olpidium bornovanus]
RGGGGGGQVGRHSLGVTPGAGREEAAAREATRGPAERITALPFWAQSGRCMPAAGDLGRQALIGSDTRSAKSGSWPVIFGCKKGSTAPTAVYDALVGGPPIRYATAKSSQRRSLHALEEFSTAAMHRMNYCIAPHGGSSYPGSHVTYFGRAARISPRPALSGALLSEVKACENNVVECLAPVGGKRAQLFNVQRPGAAVAAARAARDKR